MNETTKTSQESERDQEQTRDERTEAPVEMESPLAGNLEESQLSLEDVFEILGNERRQHVLSYLLVSEEPSITISDLAEHIAAIENDKPIDQLTSQQRKRVYVALYQAHLPKMDDADVIDFDKDRGTVEPGSNLGQLEPYLSVPDGDDAAEDVPLQHVLLTASAIGAYALAALVQPGGALAGAVVLLVGIAAFVIVRQRA